MDRSNSGNDCYLSIIVPAYNEAPYLDYCVQWIEKTLHTLTESFEIILAEDGSTDGTYAIAERIAYENPLVSVVHSKQRLGRGRALIMSFKEAKGEILAYLDADLPTNPNALGSLLKATENGHCIATGSRHLKGSMVQRPFSRWAASKIYNLLVRAMFRDGIHDHQCGFKAFRRELLNSLINDNGSDGWFWDSEIIIRANKSGYKVAEIPVEWTENRKMGGSKVKLLDDSIYFFKNLIRLWLDLNSRRDKIACVHRNFISPAQSSVKRVCASTSKPTG
jgi:glycosyltransferase involved in cell wall biosynthesis